MTIAGPKKIVLLGIMSRMPVGGLVWGEIQYLVGLQRLGYDVYYVEAYGSTPRMFIEKAGEDAWARAAGFVSGIMGRLGLADRWAFHAVHDGRRFGMSEAQLSSLYASADLIINLHGSTQPLDEHCATGRLVYLDTDPVEAQIDVERGCRVTIDYLSRHSAFYTWALNYGRSDCGVPVTKQFEFRPSPPPVVMDLWESASGSGAGPLFTTIGNWRQDVRDLEYKGETYRWSKHHEFLKVLDLPARTSQPFELALSSYEEADRELLERHGWRVRDALSFSRDLDAYRGYITGSHGEFTVAKDQNVRLRSGWFSERSATYLAAGRPVITQDTGFGNVLPTGEGLFAFSTMEEILDAIDRVNADYPRHSRAAAAIARDYFSADIVLGRMLRDLGVASAIGGPQAPAPALPDDLDLVPTSRWPTILPDSTVRYALAAPVPTVADPSNEAQADPIASIVMVTFNSLAFTKLCVSALVANTEGPAYELIVVDNGSTDGTVEYLNQLARAHRRVRIQLNDGNGGFAAASNLGLAMARGNVLVLLNNDTIVPPGWLARLVGHLDDPAIGLVGPVANRAGNEAELDAPYRTYGELLAFTRRRMEDQNDGLLDIRVLTMFCLAMRRDVFEQLGPLDERFRIGLFEDDDYSMRAREAGFRVVCADDVFVHHFGQASIGKLAGAGVYGTLFHENRRRWEEKWGRSWEPYRHRVSERYRQTIERTQSAVRDATPADAVVLVVSKGDDELLDLAGRRARHFPRTGDGVYTGYHPVDSHAAIQALEAERRTGAAFLVVPPTTLWWLDHYTGLREHLERLYPCVVRDESLCVIFDLRVDHRQPVAGAVSQGQWGGAADGAR